MALSSQCLPQRGRLFSCRFCHHPFYSQHRLETHERIHTGNKPHQCPLCYRAFSQAMYLRFHLEQIHGGSQEQAEVMVHSVSSLQTSTVLDAVVGADNGRTRHFNRSIDIQHETSHEVETRTLSFGRSSMALNAIVGGENIKTRPYSESNNIQHESYSEGRRSFYGSNIIHHESSCDIEEESITLPLDRRNNLLQESSPEPVGDIMDFAPLFLVEDLSVTAMNQPVSSINVSTSHECTSQCSPQSSFSSHDNSGLPLKAKDITGSDHHPSDAEDRADSDHLPSAIKAKADLDDGEFPIPRKIRKQQTPQKNILDNEGIVTVISSSLESKSEVDAERDLERNIISNDVTGIMALCSKSPPCLISSKAHEKKQRPSSLKDHSNATCHIQSSCQATSFQDDANHGPSSADQVFEKTDTLMNGNTSQSCQSNVHDTEMHSHKHKSGAVMLDTPHLAESNCDDVGFSILPEVPRKRKILTCELCNKTFTGTLFLRSHFRVVHGAEIIGIDSDDDCATVQEKAEEKCESNGAVKFPMPQKAKECDVVTKPEKKGRGRPKGSKNKPKGSKESVSVQIGKNKAKVRVIIKHTSESSNSSIIPRAGRNRGRPPKYKVQLNSLHVGQSKNGSMHANLPHVPSPQSITNSVIDTLMIQPLKFSNEELEPFIENNLEKERKNPDDMCGALKCDICKKEFVRKNDLRRHMRSHTGEQPFACSTCGRKFGDLAHLRDHERLHSASKEYVCKVCGMRFAQSGGLYSHSRTHEKRQYGCKVCSKRFTRKSDVQRHLRTHTDLKPFRCDICQQSFNLERLLEDHAKLHSEERRYVCSECGMRFAGRNGLHSHFKIHVDKKYECDVCCKKFSRNSAWHRHMKTHTCQ